MPAGRSWPLSSGELDHDRSEVRQIGGRSGPTLAPVRHAVSWAGPTQRLIEVRGVGATARFRSCGGRPCILFSDVVLVHTYATSRFGRDWPTVANVDRREPNLSRFGPGLAAFGRTWPEFGKMTLDPGQIPPNVHLHMLIDIGRTCEGADSPAHRCLLVEMVRVGSEPLRH